MEGGVPFQGGTIHLQPHLTPKGQDVGEGLGQVRNGTLGNKIKKVNSRTMELLFFLQGFGLCVSLQLVGESNIWSSEALQSLHLHTVSSALNLFVVQVHCLLSLFPLICFQSYFYL